MERKETKQILKKLDNLDKKLKKVINEEK